MSFDLFLFSMPEETFDRSVVERAFASFAEGIDTDDWLLRSPEGEPYSASFTIDTSPQINHISINRPPFVEEFWKAIFEVLQTTRTFLVWPAPNEPSYCVANPNWETYLGDDPLNMGRPAFVTCPAEIPEVIEASF